MADIKDKLVQAVNEFKKSLDGQTIPIHGKSYATVALRVAVARRVLGTALDIVTKIVSIDANTVVMSSDIYIDGVHVSTGHAEEKRSASKINQTSALENCETSATGRALAFLGFISDGIASADQEWLSKNKPMLSELKLKNPIAYTTFMEDFQTYKTNLQTKGVI